jgi:hypothetical protein
MSLVGRTAAVVSLGCSCQTSLQIERCAGPIADLLGDRMKPVRLPYDWMASPVDRLTAWLASEELFPATPDDLAPVYDTGTGFFRWGSRGVFFGHDFRAASGQIDVARTFEGTALRYRRCFARLAALRDLDRIVCVIANTQNNLGRALSTFYDPSDFTFTADRLARLKDALDTRFGRPVEMLAVTYPHLEDGTAAEPARTGIAVATLRPDPSDWTGDDAAWRAVFEDYFDAARPA